MTTIAGTVLAISQVSLGDVLAADATAGDTTITVDDAADFAEGGGTILIGGQLDDYTSVDDETGVMVLVDALNADALQGDRVDLADPAGSAALEWQALVAPQGTVDTDEAIQATINYAIVPLLPEGIRDPGTGESVTLTRDGTEWQVTNVHGQQPDIQGDNLGGGSSVVVGDTTGQTDAVAITLTNGAGTGSSADRRGTAVGFGSRAAEFSVAIGQGASAVDASGGLNVAVGDQALNSNTDGDANTAVGQNALETLIDGADNTGIGQRALIVLQHGSFNTAVGQNAGPTSPNDPDNSTSIGAGAAANADFASAFGAGSFATADGAISIGGTASAHQALAVGQASNATGERASCLGEGAGAEGDYSTGLGSGSDATHTYATAIGANTFAGGLGTVAIGTDSGGAGAAESDADVIKLGTSLHTTVITGALVISDGSNLWRLVVSGGALSVVAYP